MLLFHMEGEIETPRPTVHACQVSLEKEVIDLNGTNLVKCGFKYNKLINKIKQTNVVCSRLRKYTYYLSVGLS